MAFRARPSLSVGLTDQRLSAYRNALDFDQGLDLHSLRRSCVSHLNEDFGDPRFVQDPSIGHSCSGLLRICGETHGSHGSDHSSRPLARPAQR